MDERTSYSERSAWPGFLTAVLWGALILSAYPILAGWDTDLPIALRLPIAAGILTLGAAIQTLLGGLTVRVQETRVLLHLGRVPLVRRTVPFGDIRALESVVYRPLREFGGWGVRRRGSRRAWTARGNRAVKLELSGGQELFIGSDNPQRLEERIRTVAGQRLGGRP